jgi:hypothetical protein
MEILKQLSSRQGDKTEKSNKLVAGQCIQNPELLNEIVVGFTTNDQKLQSDCIEVFTIVSEKYPEMIVPFAAKIIPLLASKETKARWEAAHTLSLIADKIPEIVFSVLPELQELIEKDKSTIVRDYAIYTIANYAKSEKCSLEKTFEILKIALKLWEEKHAKQVFAGFNFILDKMPSFKSEISRLARPYLDAKKKVAASEAQKLLKRAGE